MKKKKKFDDDRQKPRRSEIIRLISQNSIEIRRTKRGRSCKSKAGYRTQHLAEAKIEECLRYRPDQTLRTYQCDYCGKWHLTSKPKRIEYAGASERA